ncbi:winged helix DNA-binding protein [Cryomorpha ignava]|uniref:Winged helix DNA-binding protein n=1 Tax=Cryomorpha ignava TaxID=101383 RepID=A0A7K3WRD9_9FLAO|nr:MarR family transcriptional regulator [Cryomorpha ignava]NEN23611.1 winged helix DNA-binding protein [Cryomorpha ignava]
MEIEQAIHQKEFANERERAIVNILYTSSWLTYIQMGVFKKYDISMQQYNVLRILKGQYPKPATVNMLIERMIDKSSNASRIVEKLRSKDLVVRSECPKDRRQVDVVLTQTGIDLLTNCTKEVYAIHKKTDKLDDAENKELNRLLNKLRS